MTAPTPAGDGSVPDDTGRSRPGERVLHNTMLAVAGSPSMTSKTETKETTE